MPTSIAHFINGTDPLRELEIPLFEIKDIPGKGKGLVARFNISSGTRILCEKPLLTVRAKSREELETILVEKLKAMPKSSQRQFLSAASSRRMLCRVDPGRPSVASTPPRALSITAASRTLTTAGIAKKNMKPSMRSDRSKAERRLQFHTIMEARQVYDRHS
jgi:hypothetical protein